MAKTSDQSQTVAAISTGSDAFVQSLNPVQCQHLMNMLQSQLLVSTTNSENEASTSHMAGICPTKHSFLPSRNCWILDSGASTHVCFSRFSFATLQPISGASVTLPNNSQISVNFSGSIRLSTSVSLQGVLFIPTFQYNLLSVSALTRDNSISVQFFNDHCLLQDKFTLKTIGRGRIHDGLYILDDSALDLEDTKNQKVICATTSNSSLVSL